MEGTVSVGVSFLHFLHNFLMPKPGSNEEGDEQYFPSWTTLPDALTIHIFSFLGASSLYNASLVCKSWFSVAFDELLWKELFYRRWGISRTVPLAPGKQSWVQEYKRLLYHTPFVESEVIKEHTDEVLHVSFSHNGKMFATASEDGFIMVWTTGYPTCLKCKTDLESVFEGYPRLQFNYNDTRLLVLYRDFCYTLTVVTCIFDITDDLRILRIIHNHHLMTFGAWYDDDSIITVEQEWARRNKIYVSQVADTCCTDDPDNINKMFVSTLNACGFGMMIVAEVTTPVLEGKSETASSKRASSLDTQSSREGDSVDVSQTRDNVDSIHLSLTGSITQPSDAKLLIFAIGLEEEEDGPNRIEIMSVKSKIKLNECQQPLSAGNSDCSNTNSHLVKLDNLLDVDGQIFGICCSPDQRFLYVSTQSWQRRGQSRTPGEMVIQVIDLQKMQKMDTVYRTGFKPINWFYFYLDVSDDYVASGSERDNGYLWDRHYGICLQKYGHDKMVNAVAFNPIDPETLVTDAAFIIVLFEAVL